MKLVAFIRIRVFFVLLFHVIVPPGMGACKIYIFPIVIRQFWAFKLHWRLHDPQYVSFYLLIFQSSVARQQLLHAFFFISFFFAFVCSSFHWQLKFCCVKLIVMFSSSYGEALLRPWKLIAINCYYSILHHFNATRYYGYHNFSMKIWEYHPTDC